MLGYWCRYVRDLHVMLCKRAGRGSSLLDAAVIKLLAANQRITRLPAAARSAQAGDSLLRLSCRVIGHNSRNWPCASAVRLGAVEDRAAVCAIEAFERCKVTCVTSCSVYRRLLHVGEQRQCMCVVKKQRGYNNVA